MERAIVDDWREQVVFEEGESHEDAVPRIESRLETLEGRVADLEATIQAVDGYVSHAQSVNEAVERQADAAISTVDRLEDRLETVEETATGARRRLDELTSHIVPDRDTDENCQQRDTTSPWSSTRDQTQSNSTIDTTEAASGDPDPGNRGFVGPIRERMDTIRDWLT